ncbi:doublecortin domain-containing protein 2 [Polypterus senegalus]|uniref:doublecortin domain-containing protein 2 n=1 Tax=Polypterus senegalus TaxID=55291 RepID=UPI0019630D76|nr:doublecortin domain-containing protein 2 [Polypterus senegalus]
MSVSSKLYTPQASPAKTILMYRNGDPFFPGRKFIINPRQTPSFENFLSSVTQGIEAQFGAVRNVYTPLNGHRVLAMEHLQHGQRYVAAGAERFKKLDYLHITTKKPQKKQHEMIQPVVHSRIIVSARWKKVLHESCTINVFKNGDVLVPPIRILIPKYTLRSWDRVLALITEKIRLRTGAVHRLCTLHGESLLGSSELENNNYYVAVGAERFKHLPYFQWIPSKGSMRVTGPRFHSEILPTINKGKRTKTMPEDHSTLSAGEESSGDSSTSKEQFKDPVDLQLQDEESFFHARQVKVKQQKHSTKYVLPLSLSEEGGVFNAPATRKETHDASEVQEEANMKVDMPIDQMAAEVVHEEQILLPDYENESHSHKKYDNDSPTASLDTELKRVTLMQDEHIHEYMTDENTLVENPEINGLE